MEKDKEINILFEHYNESNLKQDRNIKNRDLTFLFIIIDLLILLYLHTNPIYIIKNTEEFVKKYTEINIVISLSTLNSFIIFILLSLVVRYYQKIFNIEKLYKYIQNIENMINKYSKDDIIYREGKSYLAEYPLFLNSIDFFYKIIFPSVLIFIIILKIYSEYIYYSNNHCSIFFIFDILILSFTLFLVITAFWGIRKMKINIFINDENNNSID